MIKKLAALVNKRIIGHAWEQEACTYLIKQGLQVETQNYRTQRGEIDLIMRDNNTLVFVEVRYRQQSRYGGAIESITFAKRQRIISAAQHYLQKNALSEKIKCRFDVICWQSSTTISWIKDAFQVE